MSRPKHTPGPWTVNGLDIATACPAQLPVVSNIAESCPKAADARLIAAAPDMLEVIQLTIAILNNAKLPDADVPNRIDRAIDNLREVLNKAKGGAQ